VITLQYFLPDDRRVLVGLGRVNASYRKDLGGRTLPLALRSGDRNAVAALIQRFRFLLSHQPNVSQAQHDAVKAYDDRRIGLTKLQGGIAAEHQRLQNLPG
jgi:hypothetical protein